MAADLPRRLQGHGGGDHARPLLPREVVPSGSWSSSAGRASPSRELCRVARAEGRTSSRRRSGRTTRSSAAEKELEWVKVGQGRQTKSKARLSRYEELLDAGARGSPTRRRSTSRRGRGSAEGHRGRGTCARDRRPRPDRRPHLLAAAGRHRRRRRAQRRREDHADQDAHGPGARRRLPRSRSANREAGVASTRSRGARPTPFRSSRR